MERNTSPASTEFGREVNVGPKIVLFEDRDDVVTCNTALAVMEGEASDQND